MLRCIGNYRVIFYHQESGVYEIADVDDSKRYSVPERQVKLERKFSRQYSYLEATIRDIRPDSVHIC